MYSSQSTTTMTETTILRVPSSSGATVQSFLRNYATPLVMVLMMIVGASGAALFFHLGTGTVKDLHEWLGMGLLAGVVLHLARNWKGMKHLLGQPRTQVILGAVLLLTAAYLTLSPEQGGNPMRAVVMAAEQAPLSRLAPVLGTEQQVLVGRLAEAGIPASADQSVEQIAHATHQEPARLLGILTSR